MATLKYSRQRESIKNFLMQRYDHPTADTVYLHVKEEYPNISIGTVYRNLSLLSEIGEIQKISCDGPDRFDANTTPHYHFICKCCGSVSDIQLENVPSLDQIQAADFDGVIEEIQLEISGTCKDCRAKA